MVGDVVYEVIAEIPPIMVVSMLLFWVVSEFVSALLQEYTPWEFAGRVIGTMLSMLTVLLVYMEIFL